MHKTFLTRALIPVLWLLLAAVASAQGTQPGRIVLARVTGEVTLTRKDDGTTRPAVNNEQIAAGHVVTTASGASVVLIFSNGATINLRGDSVLDIETFMQDPFAAEFKVAEATAEPSTSTTRLNLTRGELIGNVKQLNAAGGSSFIVQTPVGAAGIRGTTFRIIFRPDGTGRAFFSLTTIEGNVVLIQGDVEIPVDATTGEAREISVEVDVQVDPVTGAITVVMAGQTFTVEPATAAATAAVIQALQQIIETVATQVFTPPGSGPDPSPPAPGEPDPPETPPPGQTTPTTTDPQPGPQPPPPPTPPPPRTTTGDGGLG